MLRVGVLLFFMGGVSGLTKSFILKLKAVYGHWKILKFLKKFLAELNFFQKIFGGLKKSL